MTERARSQISAAQASKQAGERRAACGAVPSFCHFIHEEMGESRQRQCASGEEIESWLRGKGERRGKRTFLALNSMLINIRLFSLSRSRPFSNVSRSLGEGNVSGRRTHAHQKERIPHTHVHIRLRLRSHFCWGR